MINQEDQELIDWAKKNYSDQNNIDFTHAEFAAYLEANYKDSSRTLILARRALQKYPEKRINSAA